MSDVLDTFAAAAATYEQLVRALPDDAWDGPGLGDWDLRALVGHTSRSLVTVEEYLQRPVEREDVRTAAEYYVAIAPLLSSDAAAAVLERGRVAGQALGEDPVASVSALVARVVPLARNAGDPLIHTIAGGMRLRRYLPTRTFELVVHSYDIAAAAGLPDPTVAPEVLSETLTLAATASVALGTGPVLIRALTGRTSLPAGFSVV